MLLAALKCYSDCPCCINSRLLWHAAVTALFNDFVSWLGDRGSKQRDGEQRTGSVHRAPVDKEAQAAAAAEIRQDAEDERGHAVRTEAGRDLLHPCPAVLIMLVHAPNVDDFERVVC